MSWSAAILPEACPAKAARPESSLLQSCPPTTPGKSCPPTGPRRQSPSHWRQNVLPAAVMAAVVTEGIIIVVEAGVVMVAGAVTVVGVVTVAGAGTRAGAITEGDGATGPLAGVGGAAVAAFPSATPATNNNAFK